MTTLINNRVNNHYTPNFWGVVILFTLFTLSIQSCRKEIESTETPSEEKECDCVPIPPYSGGPAIDGGYQYIVKNPHFSRVCYNPNDDNEILVHAVNPNNLSGPLYKYNLTTQVKEEIYNGVIKGNLEWGATDWILMTLGPGICGDIWKIKSNGDSLTQLTFDCNSWGPQWNITGDRIIISHLNEIPTRATMITSDGLILDTLYNVISSPTFDWNNNYLVGIRLGKLALSDPYEDITFSSFHQIEDDFMQYNGCETETSFATCVWENDNIYYSTGLGIFKIGMDGTNHEVIKETCSARRYMYPTINQSKTKLLWVRGEKTLINEHAVNVENFIVTMNLDGSDEQIIEIP